MALDDPHHPSDAAPTLARALARLNELERIVVELSARLAALEKLSERCGSAFSSEN